MNEKADLVPKETSYEYGYQYQLTQAEKYRNRDNNHWRYRIELAERLVGLALEDMPSADQPRTLLDVGCSIGTFAIEFARAGFRCFGVDFDQPALDMAKKIASEEGVSPTFICGDVSHRLDEMPEIDIAVCFDVFEHLHDDELGGLLSGVKSQLSQHGVLVFHTYPTQEDHIFHGKLALALPLMMLAWLPVGVFDRIARSYACLVDGLLVLARGKTHRQMIKKNSHCNLLTAERLGDIFSRSGWEVVMLETGNLYPQRHARASWFKKHAVADRNLYGIARPNAVRTDPVGKDS